MSRIKATIGEIAESYGDPYNGLLQTGLSENFNDASLCLREMHRVRAGATSKWAAGKEEQAVRQATVHTVSLVKCSWHGSEGWYDNADIKNLLLRGLDDIGQCFSISSDNSLLVDLQTASLAFLKTAEAIELILWRLKPRTFEESLEDLIYSFSRLSLRRRK